MLEPPDELLEDLQAALPPEQPAMVPRPPSNNSRSGSRQGVNGAMSPLDHLSDLHLSDEPERASITSSVSVVGGCECECSGWGCVLEIIYLTK